MKGCVGRSLQNMEVIMQDQFNLASLAKLSKNDLGALLATLTGQFHAAANEFDRLAIQAQIAAVRASLQLR